MNPLRIIAGVAGLVAVCLVLWFVLIRPGQMADRAVQAEAGQVVAEGRADMGVTSGSIYANQVGNEADTDAVTRNNAESINAASGAKVAVDPAVAAAGRAALCLRKSYFDTPACVELRRVHP